MTIRTPGIDARAMRATFLFLAALLSTSAEPATIATGSIKRFGVVSVVADKFTRSPEDFSKISQTNWWGAPDWSSIEAAVKTYCAANELDALLAAPNDDRI